MQQRTQWWVLGSGVLMLIGAFGPWVTVLGFSVNGTDGRQRAVAVASGPGWERTAQPEAPEDDA